MHLKEMRDLYPKVLHILEHSFDLTEGDQWILAQAEQLLCVMYKGWARLISRSDVSLTDCENCLGPVCDSVQAWEDMIEIPSTRDNILEGLDLMKESLAALVQNRPLSTDELHLLRSFFHGLVHQGTKLTCLEKYGESEEV